MDLLGNQHRSQLIKADSDEQAITNWLNEYTDSAHTFDAYRKESGRLLMFLRYYRLSLRDLTQENVKAFQAFLSNPPRELIGPAKPRNHPEWKPFVAPLSERSQRYSLRVIVNLMDYLLHADYVRRNPFKLIRHKRAADVTMVERYLDMEAWQTVKKALAAMPTDTPLQRAKRIRARWVLSFLYLTGARRSEAAAAEMSDFRYVDGRWWWYVNGKGGKRAQVPANNDLLSELMLYRRHLGLMTLPNADEPYPAIVALPAQDGSFQPKFLNEKTILAIVKDVCEAAAELATSAGQKSLLLSATTHWLRHTSATHQIDQGLPLHHVSAHLRHSDINTTMRYFHKNRREQHDLQQSFRLEMGDPSEDLPSPSNIAGDTPNKPEPQAGGSQTAEAADE